MPFLLDGQVLFDSFGTGLEPNNSGWMEKCLY
jgi:hypothetical protein